MWLRLTKSKDFQPSCCELLGSIFCNDFFWSNLKCLYLCSIKGDEQFVYNGDRTRDEIVKFATRLSGPPVQEVTRTISFDSLKKDRDLYFLYVGERSGPLWVRVI